MNGLRAPDVPAYLSYGIVLLVGTVVAFVSVNTLLAEKRDRWSYFATWALVASYALLPAVLFWFLDYQNVIADTSLFAALIVALGYQQVLSGAVEGIRLPGQTAAIWGVFKAWVERVEKRIDRLNQARNARLTERILTYIAASNERAARMESLVLDRSRPTSTIATDLTALRDAATGSEKARRRRVVKRLWDELRVAEPETYGELLKSDGLLERQTYWWTFRNLRSVAMCVLIAGVAVGAAYAGFKVSQPRHGDLRLSFHEWRFTRPSLTAADEFRTRKELLTALRDPQISGVGPSLVETLTYRDVPVDTAQRILDFLLLSHGPEVTPKIFEPLVLALQTPNPDIRARLQRMLVELQAAEYPDSPLSNEFDALAKWQPSKNDSAGQIDARIRAWLKWRSAPAKNLVERTANGAGAAAPAQR
jgi:hypothetical protein